MLVSKRYQRFVRNRDTVLLVGKTSRRRKMYSPNGKIVQCSVQKTQQTRQKGFRHSSFLQFPTRQSQPSQRNLRTSYYWCFQSSPETSSLLQTCRLQFTHE